MNSIKCFGECRDIANSSKHFGLDKVSTVTAASIKESDFAVMTGGDAQVDFQNIKKLDITLSLLDGTNISLFEFLHYTCLGWNSVLKKKNIPVAAKCDPIYIFIETVPRA
jgi:hypothetical protein